MRIHYDGRIFALIRSCKRTSPSSCQQQLAPELKPATKPTSRWSKADTRATCWNSFDLAICTGATKTFLAALFPCPRHSQALALARACPLTPGIFEAAKAAQAASAPHPILLTPGSLSGDATKPETALLDFPSSASALWPASLPGSNGYPIRDRPAVRLRSWAGGTCPRRKISLPLRLSPSAHQRPPPLDQGHRAPDGVALLFATLSTQLSRANPGFFPSPAIGLAGR
ncbi:hypothetical protein E4U39_000002 [Claviceps sp. Clav50 group G5]|nr:hypothetical protein E4U39_000002 [Claviceps sp. Clav50 group G5]